MKSLYAIYIPIIDLRLRFTEEIDHGVSYKNCWDAGTSGCHHQTSRFHHQQTAAITKTSGFHHQQQLLSHTCEFHHQLAASITKQADFNGPQIRYLP
ncbi:hypothetical protein [Paenibacillus sp. NPDC093718]|uniref:hypothetical protein n=1 Tax=Paenibacillus sp. NPDC093718 TaxID=3390601 RepID=UPI003CFE5EB0